MQTRENNMQTFSCHFKKRFLLFNVTYISNNDHDVIKIRL